MDEEGVMDDILPLHTQNVVLRLSHLELVVSKYCANELREVGHLLI